MATIAKFPNCFANSKFSKRMRMFQKYSNTFIVVRTVYRGVFYASLRRNFPVVIENIQNYEIQYGGLF